MKIKKYKLWHISPISGVISLLISLIAMPPNFKEFLAMFITNFAMLSLLGFFIFLYLVSEGIIKSDDVKFVKGR